MRTGIIALTAGLAATGAHAVVFSFASDSQSGAATFLGDGAGLLDGPGVTSMVLLVDDNNGPLPTISIPVEFRITLTLAPAVSTPVGGEVVHAHAINPGASFGFFDASGAPVLTGTFSGGVLASLGSAGAWGGTAGIQARDSAGGGSVTYQWQGPDNAAYGLFAGLSTGYDDASFTLTNLRALGSGSVGIPLSGGTPGGAYSSEGSFSGTANFVPAPAAIALLGSLGLLRRRR